MLKEKISIQSPEFKEPAVSRVEGNKHPNARATKALSIKVCVKIVSKAGEEDEGECLSEALSALDHQRDKDGNEESMQALSCPLHAGPTTPATGTPAEPIDDLMRFVVLQFFFNNTVKCGYFSRNKITIPS